MSSPPRYATRRRTERATTGPAVAVVARHLGVPLLPWQQTVVDVAGELVNGRPAYDTVVVSVGRRAGKSLVTLAKLIETAMSGSRRRGWYTAQTRADAALTFRDEWVPIVELSPFARYLRPRLSNGSESLAIPRSGSMMRVFAPTPKSLHGQSGDLIVFDEVWAHGAVRGAELEIAARPLMATRPDAQMWLLSSAGDIDSTWWLDWLDRGRAAVDLDTGRGICFLEWSADVDGLDLDDPNVWVDSHPAVRTETNPAGTITLDWLTAEHAANPAAFKRTYLNVTDRQGIASAPIDPALWDRLAVDGWDRTGPLVAAVDCAPEQSSSSIVIAGTVDGIPIVEMVDHRAGTGWVTDRLIELVDRWHLETVALDRYGPAGVLWLELDVAGIPLTELATRDATAAAALFVETVRTGQIRHVARFELDRAIAVARRRPVGDGSWLFSRTGSSADVSPLIAATLAHLVHPAIFRPAGAVHG